MFTAIRNRLARLVIPSGVTDVEDIRKRVFIAVIVGVAVPILLFFSITDILTGRLGGFGRGSSDLIFAGVLTALFVMLRTGVKDTIVYRILIALFVGYNYMHAARGIGDGMSIVWNYILPVIAFFLVGWREGAFWILVGAGPVMVMVVAPDLFHTYPYSEQLKARFILSFLMVSIVSGVFEALRARFYTELQKQHAELQQATAEVKVLRGLLPICSSCKNVRDDQGYWSQFEAYISSHSEAQFTHGLCPDCMQKLYPDLYAEMQKKKAGS